MAQWQLFLTLILLSSLFGGKTSYKERMQDIMNFGELDDNEQKFQIIKTVCFIIEWILAWFVSGWLLPFINN